MNLDNNWTQYTILVLIQIIIILIPIYFYFKDVQKEADLFCINKTGIINSCEVYDYKWYQPHQCFTINCTSNIKYIDVKDLLQTVK